MKNILFIFYSFGACAIIVSICMSFKQANAQSNGVVIVSEDNQRGVACYAKSHSSEHISCVKVK